MTHMLCIYIYIYIHTHVYRISLQAIISGELLDNQLIGDIKSGRVQASDVKTWLE